MRKAVPQQIGPGASRFTQREEFSGVLFAFLQHQLATNTLPQYYMP